MTGSLIQADMCLQKRLLSFIGSHKVTTFFWPDLAPIHFSRASQKWFKYNNEDSQSRSSTSRSSYYKQEPTAAKDDKQFLYRWKRSSSRVSEATVKSLMSAVRI